MDRILNFLKNVDDDTMSMRTVESSQPLSHLSHSEQYPSQSFMMGSGHPLDRSFVRGIYIPIQFIERIRRTRITMLITLKHL